MTKLKRQMPPPYREKGGEGVTCLVLRCTHSRYENEMTPQPYSNRGSRPRLLTTRTNSGPSLYKGAAGD